jgi:hypothetical protein
MDTSDYIGIGGIIATVIVGILTGVITWIIAKKTQSTKKLNYDIRVYPILSQQADMCKDLKIYYKGEELPEPYILAVDIINSGNQAIVNPPIKISAVGATYVIPGYFEDVPVGYEELWSIERSDAEECKLHIEHINPKQIIKVRLYLDEKPSQMPLFTCPMENVEVKNIEVESKRILIKILRECLEIALPRFI